jgi:predicted ATPase
VKSRASIVRSVCCLVLPCPILSCLVLSCLVLSCLVLSCLVVDFHYVPHVFVLPPSPRSIRQPSELPFHSIVKSVVLCCLVLSYLLLSCLVLSCPVLSCLIVDFPYVPHVFVLPPSPPLYQVLNSRDVF